MTLFTVLCARVRLPDGLAGIRWGSGTGDALLGLLGSVCEVTRSEHRAVFAS